MLNEDFEMITNAQKKKIWVEVKKLGYEKEEKRPIYLSKQQLL